MAEGLAASAEVLDYWFGAAPSLAERGHLWFGKDPAVDAEIRQRFETAHQSAMAGQLDDWLATPESALALIVVLDQFSRNMYRDSAGAFAADTKALECARIALARDYDQQLAPVQRVFLYLPFEHSEALADQRLSVKLFARLDDETGVGGVYDYALRHYCVIQRFGRFPHRNDCLGRANSIEETAFLHQPGSHF